jgi:hypothetical protein
MRLLFASAAFAAAAIAILPTFALADDTPPTDNGLTESTDTSPGNTTFDLGIDVSGVPHNPTAVRSFITGLAPVTQSAIMGACETFMANPDTVQSPETYAFCSNAVRG